MNDSRPVDVRLALGLPDHIVMADTFSFSVDLSGGRKPADILQQVTKGMQRFKPHAADIGLVGLSVLISSSELPATQKKELMAAANELICAADTAAQ